MKYDFREYGNDWLAERPHIMIAMIDGEKVQYDVCTSKNPPDYDYSKAFTYIGAGYIYSINGIVQGYGPDDVMHFWVHK